MHVNTTNNRKEICILTILTIDKKNVLPLVIRNTDIRAINFNK